MSKITIIESNSNDKDQTRNYMVKGEQGEAGVSPTIEVEKANGTATITITDVDGTKSFTLSDGEMTKAMVIDSLDSVVTDQPLSANQGKVLNDEIAEINSKFAVISGIIECTTTENYNNTTVNYPTGFTKDNCVVISFGSGGQSYNGGYAGLTYGYNFNSTTTGYLTGGQDRNVFLNDDNITIMYYNPTPNTITYAYKLVLMKIS